MLSDMATIAAECIKHPNRRAVWSEQLEKYVCPDTDEGQTVTLDHESRTHPPLTSQFKLVFGTAAGGTLLFCCTLRHSNFSFRERATQFDDRANSRIIQSSANWLWGSCRSFGG